MIKESRCSLQPTECIKDLIFKELIRVDNYIANPPSGASPDGALRNTRRLAGGYRGNKIVGVD